MKLFETDAKYEYLFLDKYKLQVAKPDSAWLETTRARTQAERGYLQAVVDKPQEVERELQCFEWLLSTLPPVQDVVELFGGAGLVSTMVQQLLKPQRHTLWELDSICSAHLKRVFYRKPVKVIQGDAYGGALKAISKTSTVIADFNMLTVRSLLKGSVEGSFLDGAFKLKPQAVEFTDSAVNKMHMNHSVYEGLFGEPVQTVEDYLHNFAKLGYQRWKYSLVEAAYHHGASYMLWLPGKRKLRPIRRAK